MTSQSYWDVVIAASLSNWDVDSSTGHDQPFVPAELICILYLGCCLNV